MAPRRWIINGDALVPVPVQPIRGCGSIRPPLPPLHGHPVRANRVVPVEIYNIPGVSPAAGRVEVRVELDRRSKCQATEAATAR